MQPKSTARAIILPIGPSIAYVPLSKGLFALIDSLDIVIVEGFNWWARCDPKNNTFYAKRHDRPAFKVYRQIEMHTAIFGKVSKGMTVDHRNGNTLDYRRCNLRAATYRQNMQNRKRQKNNKSGFKGVTARNGRWRAVIGSKHIGVFDSPEAAHLAYCNAAKELYGDFARME